MWRQRFVFTCMGLRGPRGWSDFLRFNATCGAPADRGRGNGIGSGGRRVAIEVVVLKLNRVLPWSFLFFLS